MPANIIRFEDAQEIRDFLEVSSAGGEFTFTIPGDYYDAYFTLTSEQAFLLTNFIESERNRGHS